MVVIIQAQPCHAPKRALCQIETPHHFLLGNLFDLSLLLFWRETLQVNFSQLQFQLSRYLLCRHAVPHREGSAQYLVPPDHFIERILQSRTVHLAFKSPLEGHVIDCIAWLESISKPQALLGIGKRHFLSPWRGNQSGCLDLYFVVCRSVLLKFARAVLVGLNKLLNQFSCCLYSSFGANLRCELCGCLLELCRSQRTSDGCSQPGGI